MWKKFHVFKDWQQEVIDFYRRRGYVELPMGFRRSGYLTINEIINTPIQGTAFHCLLWSYIQISKLLRERGLRSRIRFQVHDSLIINLYPEESEEVRALVRGVMCSRIRKELDFIIVPLDIEEEITPVNGSWYEKKAI
jgi:DNA polymerase I-like protein with 3'-5' exonuclease and polymerase domains